VVKHKRGEIQMNIQVDQVEVGVTLYDAGPEDDVGCRYVAKAILFLPDEAGHCAHSVCFDG
jgi:hypothetical protein